MKPLRIGILTSTFLPKFSGAEIFHHNLASHLASAGHQPVVMAPRSLVRRLQAREWKLPYQVEGYPANFWSYLKYNQASAFWLNRRALSHRQRRHRFHVWHAVGLHPSGIFFADWQSRSRVPGLLRPVGDDVRGLPGQGHPQELQALLREKVPLGQATIALSPGMAGDLKAMGVASSRIHEVPNAVDCRRFLAAVDRPSLRQAAGLPSQAFVFLCVARNHPQKDFPTLFRAFRALIDKSGKRALFLAVAGRGVHDLAASAEAEGLSGKIKFFEFGPAGGVGLPQTPPAELVDLYRSSDAFVLTSLLEGFSSALLEAMAASLPVVATAAPGILEVISDGINGLLRPCGDEEGLAEAMHELVVNAPLRGQLAVGARSSAEKYDWSSVTSLYLELYHRLIEERFDHGRT